MRWRAPQSLLDNALRCASAAATRYGYGRSRERKTGEPVRAGQTCFGDLAGKIGLSLG